MKPPTHVVSLGDEIYYRNSFAEALTFVSEHAEETRVIVIMPVEFEAE
jgi:hypothetical protein